MDKRIENIETQSNNLREIKTALDELQNAMDKMEHLKPQFDSLMEYYSSENWINDYDASNSGEIAANINQGVLSQDAVYDMYGQQRKLSFKTIRTMLSYLE